MRFLRKLSDWYFTKKTLPYWCILLLDCIIVVFSGYVGHYLNLGGSGFASQFWQMTRGLLAGTLLFVILFRIFHTYSGIVRYSSFIDLQTVTHPDIIRFFMLIPEACKLVLEAGTMGKGGEIFVFDMGKPVKIVDLANRMISLSGAKDVKIAFTGMRDGEKLYEEVLNEKEGNLPTTHPKIKVAQTRKYDYATACENERRLMEVSESFDDMAIVKVMKEIVPEYKSRQSKYEVLDK